MAAIAQRLGTTLEQLEAEVTVQQAELQSLAQTLDDIEKELNRKTPRAKPQFTADSQLGSGGVDDEGDGEHDDNDFDGEEGWGTRSNHDTPAAQEKPE